MHLVLKSSKAKGVWSFRTTVNKKKVQAIFEKFDRKYGVRILSIGNAGNHLHLQIQLTSRYTYKAFIRAVTAAIAMAITGRNRWTVKTTKQIKFWDYRPFTRVVIGWKAVLGLRDYIRINQLEGAGYSRQNAEFFVRKRAFNSA